LAPWPWARTQRPDVAIAVTLLTSSVVNRYAGDPAKADELMTKIRSLENRLLTKGLGVEDRPCPRASSSFRCQAAIADAA